MCAVLRPAPRNQAALPRFFALGLGLLSETAGMHKPRTLMEQIHVLHKAARASGRQRDREPDPQHQSSLDATQDDSSDYDVIGEFAGDALATLEDWEAELTLDDLGAGRTKIH
jgi:hypothetical protein